VIATGRRISSLLTVVRETENKTRTMANKPRDYKKEMAYQRENYRRFEAKICNSDARPLMRSRPLGRSPSPPARRSDAAISEE